MADQTKPVTTHELLAMKERGERIVALTCYDALFARLLDASRVDVLLVGDSVNQRSEEHTSELQSPCNLVCRLLLEKKNAYRSQQHPSELMSQCKLVCR